MKVIIIQKTQKKRYAICDTCLTSRAVVAFTKKNVKKEIKLWKLSKKVESYQKLNCTK